MCPARCWPIAEIHPAASTSHLNLAEDIRFERMIMDSKSTALGQAMLILNYLERAEGVEPYSARLGRPATNLMLARFIWRGCSAPFHALEA